MKKIYLVHCWGGKIEDGWYPWIRQQIKQYGIDIITHNMPDTDEPKIEKWINSLEEMVEKLDKDTYFIGHSIGCQTILRYLERKDIDEIGGILFVAPWFDLLPEALVDGGDKIACEWLNTPINVKKVKQLTRNITSIFSDDDYFVSLENEKQFKNKLGSKTVIIKNKGHISKEDGIMEEETILKEIKELIKI